MEPPARVRKGTQSKGRPEGVKNYAKEDEAGTE